MRALPPAWFAGGYTSSPTWLPWVLGAAALLPLALLGWLTWRVWRSGPRPWRDTVLTWVLLAASALCLGLAWPDVPWMTLPAAVAVVMAVGCTARVWRNGGSRAAVLVAWVGWLPASLGLGFALR